MKRTMLLAAVMTMSMLLTSVDASAQHSRHERKRERTEQKDRRDNHRDRHGNGHDRHYDDGHHRGHDRYGHATPTRHRPQPMPHRGRMVRCTPPPGVRRGGYVPGWEGRVRHHHDGRWAYHVGGTWVYYDCYYNPYEFFCEPMPPRPRHPAPVVHVRHGSAGEMAAGVAAGTMIGYIIGSMAQ